MEALLAQGAVPFGLFAKRIGIRDHDQDTDIQDDQTNDNRTQKNFLPVFHRGASKR